MKYEKSNDTIQLIQRSLALKHKLRVHESLPPPQSHEEISLNLIAQWELEDELQAIERILLSIREENIERQRETILKDGVKKKKIE